MTIFDLLRNVDLGMEIYKEFWSEANTNLSMDEDIIVRKIALKRGMSEEEVNAVILHFERSKIIVNTKLLDAALGMFGKNIIHKAYEPSTDMVVLKAKYDGSRNDMEWVKQDLPRLMKYIFQNLFQIESVSVALCDKDGLKHTEEVYHRKDLTKSDLGEKKS